MTEEFEARLIKMLMRHEGFRLKPYVDTVGKLTIGVGRNLTDVGISGDEVDYMLRNDISHCIDALEQNLSFFKLLDEARKMILIDMVFNLGIGGLMQFKKMLAAIAEARYEDAAMEMLDSLWAKQVKGRAIELSGMMRTGVMAP